MMKSSPTFPDNKFKSEMDSQLSTNRKKVFPIILIASSIIAWAAVGMALDKVNQTFFGVAIKGYDAVAYHTEGQALKGNKSFPYVWNDAKWYFANSENRDLFAADPERYAPQYGGY
jgi:YHS domain-containing protein